MTQEGHALYHWLGLKRSREAPAPSVWTAETLHQRYLADVFAYVARRIPHTQEAEDVTAEVFAAAFAALPHRTGPHGPYPWLLGIARRKIADSHRRHTRVAGSQRYSRTTCPHCPPTCPKPS